MKLPNPALTTRGEILFEKPTAYPTTIVNSFQILQETTNASHVQELVWDSLRPYRENVNAYFLIAMAIQIHIMQCGFALLEAGCVRAKSATSSMWRNCVCGFVAALGFYISGFPLAFGDSVGGFLGSSYWGFADMSNGQSNNNANMWFFQYSFCTTAATIISGAIAERAHISVFLLSSFFMSSLTYPIVVHWVWHADGWLKQGPFDRTTGDRISFEDFAGSGVVHLTGGAASLAGLIAIGARKGRFLSGGDDKFEPLGHSTTLAALGGMILSTEFVSFNAGSQMHLDKADDGAKIGLAAVNTMLSGAGGMLSVALFMYWKKRAFPLLPPLCGSLAANVAICASCDVVETWAAIVIGILAGLIYVLVSWLVTEARLDDPVDAVGVHLGGGLSGLIFLALFKPDYGVFYKWDTRSFLYLGWQLLGACVIFGWAFVHTLILCCVLRWLKCHRIPDDMEHVGADVAQGHEEAYPQVAYLRRNSTARIHTSSDTCPEGRSNGVVVPAPVHIQSVEF